MKNIPLTQGQFAIVDDEDFEEQGQWDWYAQWVPSTKSYRAVRREKGTSKIIYMHREIMKTPDGVECDHVHHNTLDNRKRELRNATKSQNAMNARIRDDNTSGYKGVSKHGKKWRAYINHEGRRFLLGSHSSPEIAARAYDEEAKKRFGDFAHLNFQEDVS